MVEEKTIKVAVNAVSVIVHQVQLVLKDQKDPKALKDLKVIKASKD